ISEGVSTRSVTGNLPDSVNRVPEGNRGLVGDAGLWHRCDADIRATNDRGAVHRVAEFPGCPANAARRDGAHGFTSGAGASERMAAANLRRALNTPDRTSAYVSPAMNDSGSSSSHSRAHLSRSAAWARAMASA